MSPSPVPSPNDKNSVPFSRAVYMAFGHDEEVGGQEGAKNLAKLLTERGIKADMILDEGAVVIGGTLSGLGKPLALLGIAEKGTSAPRIGPDQALRLVPEVLHGKDL